MYSNKDVVPTNIYLIFKFWCHINVEIPISIKALKYLYKYITKGQDHTAMCLTVNDEVNNHVDGRFFAAHEGKFLSASLNTTPKILIFIRLAATWCLLQEDLSGRHPSVERLALHLENHHTVHFATTEQLHHNIESGKASWTTLTEFFQLCSKNIGITQLGVSVRELLYAEVSEYFRWCKDNK